MQCTEGQILELLLKHVPHLRPRPVLKMNLATGLSEFSHADPPA